MKLRLTRHPTISLEILMLTLALYGVSAVGYYILIKVFAYIAGVLFAPVPLEWQAFLYVLMFVVEPPKVNMEY